MYNHFAGMPVLLDGQNYMRVRTASVKQMFQLLELLFNVAANCRCDIHMPPRIFKSHCGFYLPCSPKRVAGQRAITKPQRGVHASREYSSDLDTLPLSGAKA